MDISGTLHFYSGNDKELFFVFDDVVAQDMYHNDAFDIDDLASRRVYISVGDSRFIHRRTLSFSRKQTEIKVSLCSRNTKDGLGSLTQLYDWFAARGIHPTPFGLLGRLSTVPHNGNAVLELKITESEGLVAPPGLPRRRKTKSRELKSFEHRREIQEKDLVELGRRAEELALRILREDFPEPNHTCLWRKQFLDSERIEIRRMGILADIDVWNTRTNTPERFIEVKAQKIVGVRAKSVFHLSSGEWRSFQNARGNGYEIWLFQYRDVDDFRNAPQNVNLIIFEEMSADWLTPEGYLITPPIGFGRRRRLQ